jgi:pSer/pThr/pTyr-binding forkhead associated (FHA) protein
MATVAPASAFVQADPMNIDPAGPQTLAAQIVVVRRNGKDASSRLDLFRDEGDLVVGRTDEADIRVNIPTVSRRQAVVRYRATTAEDGHATEPGAFTIANYGKVNPTLVDGVKVTPEGRELVLPHGAVFTVADRSFRVEYVWGRTPGHAAGLQRRLDREREAGLVVGGDVENMDPSKAHAGLGSVDATQDLSKFVRVASKKASGRAFGQQPRRLESVQENGPACGLFKTLSNERAVAPVKLANLPSLPKGKIEVQDQPRASSNQEDAMKVDSPAPAPALAPHAPAEEESCIVEVASAGTSVPSISSQPILTFSPEEEAESPMEDVGPDVFPTPSPPSDIAPTLSSSAPTGEDMTTGSVNFEAIRKGDEAYAMLGKIVDQMERDQPAPSMPTPIRTGINSAATELLRVREMRNPTEALPTPLKTGIQVSASAFEAAQVAKPPAKALATPMRAGIVDAAAAMNEHQAAKVPAQSLPTPMRAGIQVSASAFEAAQVAKPPAKALATPMRAGIVDAAAAMNEHQAAKVPARTIPTPMKNGIVASVSNIQQAQAARQPGISLPTPLKASISTAASIFTERQLHACPDVSMPTPVKTDIALAAVELTNRRVHNAYAGSLTTPMRSGIAQSAALLKENQIAKIPSRALSTPLKTCIAESAAAIHENQAVKQPTKALPTPVRADISLAASAFEGERASKTEQAAASIGKKAELFSRSLTMEAMENKADIQEFSNDNPKMEEIFENDAIVIEREDVNLGGEVQATNENIIEVPIDDLALGFRTNEDIIEVSIDDLGLGFKSINDINNDDESKHTGDINDDNDDDDTATDVEDLSLIEENVSKISDEDVEDASKPSEDAKYDGEDAATIVEESSSVPAEDGSGEIIMEEVIECPPEQNPNGDIAENGNDRLSPGHIESMSYRELRSSCKEHGLPANGKAADLKSRLLSVIGSTGTPASSDDADMTEAGEPAPSVPEVDGGGSDSSEAGGPENARPDVDGMSYTELRSTCKELGLPANGKGAALKDRLAKHFQALGGAASGEKRGIDDVADAVDAVDGAAGAGTKRQRRQEADEEAEEAGEEAVDYKRMTVAQLRAELEGRGLDTSGRKADLVARLQNEGIGEEKRKGAAPAFSEMKVAQLRKECAQRQLDARGRKAELVARLEEATS